MNHAARAGERIARDGVLSGAVADRRASSRLEASIDELPPLFATAAPRAPATRLEEELSLLSTLDWLPLLALALPNSAPAPLLSEVSVLPDAKLFVELSLPLLLSEFVDAIDTASSATEALPPSAVTALFWLLFELSLPLLFSTSFTPTARLPSAAEAKLPLDVAVLAVLLSD